jgi:GTPase
MKFRLSEGSGECFYYLGVEDDGYPRGLEDDELQDTMAVLHHMAQSLQVGGLGCVLTSGNDCKQDASHVCVGSAVCVVGGQHAVD